MDSGRLEPGEKVGSYRVVRRIGSGAMGAVYEVEHARLGVRYALKVFAFDGKNTEFLKKRFLAEGRLLARLNHPRIVRVYDMDVADDFAWFTMDYVEGPNGTPRTLGDMPKAGAVPESQIAGWYEDVREAFVVVHSAGIVHRDVKLENILIGRDGRAVLSDFGISRIVDDDLRRALEVTRTMVTGGKDAGLLLGTAAYLAPELTKGTEPTSASDWYALGVAFFRLLTGMWYEPGPHAFDLLAPFACPWKKLFAALLSTEPEQRCAPSFACPPTRNGRSLRWILSFLLAFAAFAVIVLFLSQKAQKQPDSVEPVDDEFAIPASVD